ncbi:DUF975 family protein [Lactococcus termiticola]|uniref:Integral membrane protein n=1 Tax=Lactococcus termiticola TaxID=2169526 RepID=A0A2R5HHU4_9LACT|nr:DUF975 family protein [Lactococcus termiticola]GBG97456.1 hypothetical protein NtB2_01602 [Lactococcus termiticola]
MTRQEIKATAKAKLKTNFTAKMLMFVIPILLGIFSEADNLRQGGNTNPTEAIFQEVNQTLQSTDLPLFLSSFLIAFILLLALVYLFGILYTLIEVGGVFQYIKIYRDEVEVPRFKDVFSPFRDGSAGKIIPVYSLIFIIALGLLLIPVVGWVFLIYLALGWSQSPMVLFDKIKDGTYSSAWDVMKTSANLMKGKRGNYFLFLLSFIGWFFLNGLTLSIANFWVTPYVAMSHVAYYQNLIDNQK